MTSICVSYYHRLSDDLEKIIWWPKIFLCPTATPDNWLLKLWWDCCRDGVLLHFNVSSCRNHGPGVRSSPGFPAAIRRYEGPDPGAAAEVNGASAPVSHHARLFPVKVTRRSSGARHGAASPGSGRVSLITRGDGWRMGKPSGRGRAKYGMTEPGRRKSTGPASHQPSVYAGHPGWEAREQGMVTGHQGVHCLSGVLGEISTLTTPGHWRLISFFLLWTGSSQAWLGWIIN